MKGTREQQDNTQDEILFALAVAVLFAIGAWKFFEIIHNAWIAVLSFLLALALALVIIDKKKQIVTGFRNRLELRRTGLREVWQRQSSFDRDRLESVLLSAQAGDEILIAGRTNIFVLEKFSDKLKDAIQRGTTVRMLLLRSARTADLRQLGYSDDSPQSALSGLNKDLTKATALLTKLRNSLLKEVASSNDFTVRPGGGRGSLLVYETAFVVLNSAVILFPAPAPKALTRIIYDFSFGPEESKKWVQYYERRNRDENTFVAQLKDFYSEMFKRSSSLLSYSLSYGPGERLHKEAIARMNKIISDHPEAENVRVNTLRRLLPATANVFSTMDLEPAQRTAPISVQIELTNRCSTKCNHCSRFKNPPNDLSKPLAEALFDKLAAMGTKTITLSGGEPTQHPQFPDLIRYADEKGLKVGVLSNGVGLRPECLEAIRKHASWLRLSIDGGDDDRRVRTPFPLLSQANSASCSSAFDQACETLRSFNQPGKKCALGICYTIQRDNYKGLAGMIEKIAEINPGLLKNLTFKFAHGGNDDSAASYVCTEKQIEELLESVLPDLKDKVTGTYPANLGYLANMIERRGVSEIASGTPTKALYEHTPTRCFTPYLFSVVDVEGDVYPCCFLYEDNKSGDKAAPLRKKHWMGNVSEGFDIVWRDNPYEDLRRALRVIDPSQELYQGCGRCTRHCDHNTGLTQLHHEYESLTKLDDDAKEASRVLADVGGADPQEALWL